MRPTITITTDFGHKGPYVATMKGVIHRHCPEARVIDLTHEIHPHWPAEAGFWLRHSYRYFPGGSVHVAVVDPGVGTERDILVASFDEHCFLAPDNGLLPLVIGADHSSVRTLDSSWLRTRNWPAPSRTFHGRDIFAPLAAELAAGSVSPEEVGPLADSLVPAWLEPPEVSGRSVRGAIVAVDSFGNLISNIDAGLVSAFRHPIAQAGGHNFKFQSTYGKSNPGDFLALINSFGVVEIACAEGSAEQALGLARGAPVVVRDTIPF